MLHACFIYDPICFMCLFIQYLAFSGTNQCQFLFSAVFVFQKSCTENILGIERDKLPAPYNYEGKTVPENDRRGVSRVARPHPRAASPGPAPGGGSGGCPAPTPVRPARGPCRGGIWPHPGSPDSPSSPIYSPIRENPRET